VDVKYKYCFSGQRKSTTSTEEKRVQKDTPRNTVRAHTNNTIRKQLWKTDNYLFNRPVSSTMVITHLRSAGQGKYYIYVPSFLRNDFGITDESQIDINKEDGKIVIRVVDKYQITVNDKLLEVERKLLEAERKLIEVERKCQTTNLQKQM